MAEYFRHALGPLTRQSIVADAVLATKPWKPQAIAVTGMSGAVIGSIVAHELRVPLILVRKEGDSTHAVENVTYGEGSKRGSRYMIVDDFVVSGMSVDRITKELGRDQCIGVYCYENCDYQEVADTLYNWNIPLIQWDGTVYACEET